MKKITSIFITLILLFICGCAPKTNGKPNLNCDVEIEYSVIGEPETKNASEFAEIFGQPAVAILVKHNVIFKKYEMHYTTIDMAGKPITLSAALTVPFLNGVPCFNKFIIDNHATIIDKSLAPTECWDMFLVNAIADSAVFECDLIGYGITVDKIVPYDCKHIVPVNTVHGTLCAIDFLEKEFSITINDYDTYNVGYSQGAYNALALLWYMETLATKNQKSKINIVKTYVGSGAYDPQYLLEDNFETAFAETPEYMLTGIMAMLEYHPEYFNGQKIEDLLTDYGKQFIEPILNKSIDEINAVKEQTDVHGNLMLNDMHDVFIDDMFDKNSEYRKSSHNASLLESLTDGSWIPKGELMMYYTLCDDLISPRCSLVARNLFGEKDYITYVVDEESKKVNHRDGGTNFYIKVLTDLLSR